MKITLETNFVPLIHAYGDLPEGVDKNVIPSMERRDLFSDPTAVAVFSFASSMAVSVFANWLYEKMKNKPSTKIRINRKAVSIDKNEIIRVISEEIEIEQK